MRQEMLERRKQKGSESARRGVRFARDVFLEQPGKECLSQVLGVGGRMALSADEGIERIPVDMAERFQRIASAGRRSPTSRKNHGPLRRSEVPSTWFAGCHVLIRCRHGAIVSGGSGLWVSQQIADGLKRQSQLVRAGVALFGEQRERHSEQTNALAE